MRQYLELRTGGDTLGHTVLRHRQILKNISPPPSIFFRKQNIVLYSFQFTLQILLSASFVRNLLFYIHSSPGREEWQEQVVQARCL